jgi:hypothetical protein
VVNLVQFRKRFLTAATFAQRAFREMEALSNESYWQRPKEDHSKFLIEEVLPLAMVAKHLDIPGRRVRCKYLGPSGKSDGQVKIDGEWVKAGFLKPFYNVEVTLAQFEKAHYVREALARYGSVFDDPDIHRIGLKKWGNGRIVSRAVAKDGDQTIKDSVHWIAKAAAKKIEKSYPQPCLLIIAIDPGRPLALGEWLEVIKSFPRDATRHKFELTFLVHTDVGAVHFAG